VAEDTPTTPPLDIEDLTQQFVIVRDLIDEVKEHHAKRLEPLENKLNQLTGQIRSFMDAHGLENIRTKAGTAYTSTRHTATVQDAEAFMNFIREHGLWDLIERRANSTAVKDFVKQHNKLPAGVNLNGIQTLGVRRRAGKK